MLSCIRRNLIQGFALQNRLCGSKLGKRPPMNSSQLRSHKTLRAPLLQGRQWSRGGKGRRPRAATTSAQRHAFLELLLSCWPRLENAAPQRGPVRVAQSSGSLFYICLGCGSQAALFFSFYTSSPTGRVSKTRVPEFGSNIRVTPTPKRDFAGFCGSQIPERGFRALWDPISPFSPGFPSQVIGRVVAGDF